MIEFFELKWIFNLKAVSVLNRKKTIRPKKVYEKQVQLRQFFIRKSVSVLKISNFAG